MSRKKILKVSVKSPGARSHPGEGLKLFESPLGRAGPRPRNGANFSSFSCPGPRKDSFKSMADGRPRTSSAASSKSSLAEPDIDPGHKLGGSTGDPVSDADEGQVLHSCRNRGSAGVVCVGGVSPSLVDGVPVRQGVCADDGITGRREARV